MMTLYLIPFILVIRQDYTARIRCSAPLPGFVQGHGILERKWPPWLATHLYPYQGSGHLLRAVSVGILGCKFQVADYSHQCYSWVAL